MTTTLKPALLVIDLQNDYFPGGKYPLWNTEIVLHNIEGAIDKARASQIPVIFIQHLAKSKTGIAPFLNPGSSGAEIHPRLLQHAPNAHIVTKHFADSFVDTTLETTLTELGVNTLYLCGMMTHNCVNHTALSKSAEKYQSVILHDCCTTVDEMLHQLALHAVSTRIKLVDSSEVL